MTSGEFESKDETLKRDQLDDLMSVRSILTLHLVLFLSSPSVLGSNPARFSFPPFCMFHPDCSGRAD